MPRYAMEAPNKKVYEIDGPEGASDEDIAGAILSLYPESGKVAQDESLGDVYNRRLTEAQGVRPGLDPDNEFGGDRFINGIPNPLSTVRDIADLAARGGEYVGAAFNTGLEKLDDAAVASGLADRLSVGGNKFLPGSAIGALTEAFPLGGAEIGMVNPAAAAARREFRSLAQQKFDAGATRAELDALAKEQGTDAFGPDLDVALEYRDKGGKGARIFDEQPTPEEQLNLPMEEQHNLPFDRPLPEEAKLKAEADAFVASKPEEPDLDFRQRELPLEQPQEQLRLNLEEPQPKAKTPEAVRTPSDDVVDTINETVSDWKNSPEFKVHDSFDDIDELDSDALGSFDTETGQIHINAKAVAEEAEARGITPQEMTKSVVFHEGLGHFGMEQRFRQTLDGILGNFYKKSADFRTTVDDWINDNPDAYGGELNPLARAAEEVLAEMSEKGTIPLKLQDQIKNYVKATVRKMGLNLDFSMREIKTILSQVHDDVVNGTKQEQIASGQRYMMRRYGKESKGPLQGSMNSEDTGTTPLANFRSKRNVEDILKENAPEKAAESWDDWIDQAGRERMTRSIATGLEKGTEVPQLLAAEKMLLESANRIFDLSRKSVDKGLSERETYLLGKEIESHQDMSKAVSEVVSNAARVLNSRKIEISSDKALSDGIRRMASRMDVNDPESIKKAVKAFEKGNKRAQRIAKILNVVAEATNLPRSLESSTDLSAPFRQGIFLVGEKEFWKNIMPMFKYFGSASNFKTMMDSIKDRPSYPMMERAGLALSDLGTDLTKREEQFISTWAEKIPVYGRVVKASERAYSGFLNKLRADTFDSLLKDYKDAGIKIDGDIEKHKDMAKFINAATGRGSLGSWDKAAPALSGLFFSPRLMASRVQMLNPAFYYKLDPVVRKRALKSLVKFGGVAATVAGLAKMAGADVETDPRSSDFAKIKVGKTRYDILGGFGQYLTLGARIATNHTKNIKGEVKELGKGYGSKTRKDVAETFLENKFAPIPGFVRDYLQGQNPVGEEFSVTETDPTKNAIGKLFIPLILQDFKEIIEEEGPKGALMGVPGIFGIGTQTYDVELGQDVFGRDVKELQDKDEDESDPAVLEVQRLNEVSETPVVNPVGKTVGKEKLSDEDYKEYQGLAGQYILEDINEVMKEPEWQDMTDEDKIEAIREITREARKAAREELFND